MDLTLGLLVAVGCGGGLGIKKLVWDVGLVSDRFLLMVVRLNDVGEILFPLVRSMYSAFVGGTFDKSDGNPLGSGFGIDPWKKKKS